MDICIIIPSINLWEKLEKCLDAILLTNFKRIDIIIIDNNSDTLLETLLKGYKSKFKSLHFLRNKSNIGFARSMNQGIKYAIKNFKKIDYFLLLNNDAYVKKNFFTESTDFLERVRPDLMSPLILLTHNRGIDSMGLSYHSDGTVIDRKTNKSNNLLLNGACLFVSVKFVRQSLHLFGWLFIPEFNSYIEDAELSLRALLMGKKLNLISKFLLYHDRSASIVKDKALYLGSRNQLWTIITTWTNKMILKNFIEIFRGQIIIQIVYILKLKIWFMVSIYIETIINLPRLLKIRKKIQTSLSVEYPANVFLDQSISLTMHIKRSFTYKRLLNFIEKHHV